MRKNRQSRWPVALAFRALFFGLIFSTLVAYTIAAFFEHGTGRVVDFSYPKKYAPKYLDSLAPPLENDGYRSIPLDYSSYEPYLWGMNIGFDQIDYFYGQDNEYDIWDPNQADIPLKVYFTRFRFGWPKRILSYDEISTGISVSDPDMLGNFDPDAQAYHERVSKKAGRHQGLNRPSWLPEYGTITLDRVPIAINWRGLFADTVFWSFFWILPGTLWRAVRTYRRKRRGLCPACGYAVKDLETCPECGTDHAVSIEKLET